MSLLTAAAWSLIKVKILLQKVVGSKLHSLSAPESFQLKLFFRCVGRALCILRYSFFLLSLQKGRSRSPGIIWMAVTSIRKVIDVTLQITRAGQNDCKNPQQKLSLHLQWSRYILDRRDDTRTAFFCINRTVCLYNQQRDRLVAILNWHGCGTLRNTQLEDVVWSAEVFSVLEVDRERFHCKHCWCSQSKVSPSTQS